MNEEGIYLVTEQMAEDTATTKRIEGDKLERQMKEDKKKECEDNPRADPRAGDAIFRCHPILLRGPHLNLPAC